MREKHGTPASAAMVQRVRFEPHDGFSLCFIDFTNSRQTQATLEMIKHAQEVIGGQPFNWLRTLTDVSDSYMPLPVISAMHRFARSNKPHVQRSAMIGLSPIHRTTLREVNRIAGRDIREFKTREAALEYLLGD